MARVVMDRVVQPGLAGSSSKDKHDAGRSTIFLTELSIRTCNQVFSIGECPAPLAAGYTVTRKYLAAAFWLIEYLLGHRFLAAEKYRLLVGSSSFSRTKRRDDAVGWGPVKGGDALLFDHRLDCPASSRRGRRTFGKLLLERLSRVEDARDRLTRRKVLVHAQLKLLGLEVLLLLLGQIVGAEPNLLVHELARDERVDEGEAELLLVRRVVAAQRRVTAGGHHSDRRVTFVEPVEPDLVVALNELEVVLKVPRVRVWLEFWRPARPASRPTGRRRCSRCSSNQAACGAC